METNMRKYKYLLNLLLIIGTIIFIDGLLHIFKMPSLRTLIVYPMSDAILPDNLALIVKHGYSSLWVYIFILSIILKKWISYIEHKAIGVNTTSLTSGHQNKRKFISYTIFYWCTVFIISILLSISSDSLDGFLKSALVLSICYFPPYILFLSPLPKTLKMILGVTAFIITTIVLVVFFVLFKAALPMFDGSFAGGGCNSIVAKNIFTGSLREYTCTKDLPWYESEVEGIEASSFLQEKCIENYGKEYDSCYSYIPIEWKTYTNNSYNFSINYPVSLPMIVDGDWSYIDDNIDKSVFFGPITSEPENFQSRYIFVISVIDTAKYDRDIETEIKNFEYRVERKYNLKGNLEKKNFIINDIPATLAIITTPHGQAREVYIMKDEQLYIISDNWNNNTESNFDTFYKSFKFLK